MGGCDHCGIFAPVRQLRRSCFGVLLEKGTANDSSMRPLPATVARDSAFERARAESEPTDAVKRAHCERELQNEAKEWQKEKTHKRYVGGEGVLQMNAAPHGYWAITLLATHGRPVAWLPVFLVPYFCAGIAISMLGPSDDEGIPLIVIPQGTEALAGSALMFLLVFRTNAAYDRWYEGRKHWGAMINRTRDLSRQAVANIQDFEHVNTLVRYTIAFAVCMKHSLRFERDVGELQTLGVLTREAVVEIEKAEHLPNFVLDVLSRTLVS